MKRFVTSSTLVLFTILSGFPVSHGKSLDEIDRESFAARYVLSELPGIALSPVKSIEPVEEPEVLSLDGTWLMAEGGDETARVGADWSDAMEAVVPGSVHTALVANGVIPDPYIGQNDSIAEKQSYKTWWFRKDFSLDRLPASPVLSFGGVDNR